MLEFFRKLLTDLSEYYHEDGAGVEKPAIDNAILEVQLKLLHNACEELDMDAMEAVGSELRRYAYPDSIKDTIDSLLHAIDRVNPEGCDDLIEKIREYIRK